MKLFSYGTVKGSNALFATGSFAAWRHEWQNIDAGDGEAAPPFKSSAGPGRGNGRSKTKNSAPTDLVLSNDDVLENAANGTLVGTVTAIDPDANETFRFSLSDSAGGRFVIDSSTGRISIADTSLLDFETQSQHTITVSVRDSAKNSYSEQFTIHLLDEPEADPLPPSNQAPSIGSLSNASVDENSPGGTVVGTVAASDPDAGDTLTFALLDDAAGRFMIDAASGVVSVANGAVLDFEAAASHRIQVRVTDGGGLVDDQAFTIAVNDLPEDASASPDAPDHVFPGLAYGDLYRWNNDGPQGSAATVTFTFLQTLPDYYVGQSYEPAGFAPFSAAQQAAAREILDFVADITNLTFVETTDVHQAQITFGLGEIYGNWGYAWRPSSFDDGIDNRYGDVWIKNASQTANVNPGTYGKFLLTHEIGHSLGLRHPNTTYFSEAEDSQKFTVMSYDYYLSKYPLGFQVYDVAVLQQLYGLDTSYHAGNDTYDVMAFSGKLKTLVDGGGDDTLDASGATFGVTLDLNPGGFSSVGTSGDNLAIAYGTTIENAIGGTGADLLIGNTQDNTLTGGAGGDTFRFGAGWGNDVVTDFQAGSDILDFSATGLGFADLTIYGSGGDTIVAGGSDDVTLLGIDAASLGIDDFAFA